MIVVGLLSFQVQASEILDSKTAHEKYLKICDVKALNDCFEKDRSTASHPFLMTHGKKTKYVVLLLHGLSDSPYFFKDIAQAMFHKGMNVYAPLWSGHGTDPEHLSKMKLKNWVGDPKKAGDLQWVMKKALEYGDKIVIGGLSMGGGVSYYASMIYPKYIAAQVLFSPYLRTKYMPHLQACMGAIFNKYGAEKVYGVGVRYQKISAKAACEVAKLYVHRVLPLMKAGVRLKVPTYMMLTEYDSVVHMKYSVQMIEKEKYAELTAKQKSLLFYLEEEPMQYSYSGELKAFRTDRIPHASVLLKESVWDPEEVNPEYAAFEKSLIQFLEQNLEL